LINDVLLTLLLLIVIVPVTHVVYAQNILDEIGRAFSNLTSGLMGEKDIDQSLINQTIINSSNTSIPSSSISDNQMSSN